VSKNPDIYGAHDAQKLSWHDLVNLFKGHEVTAIYAKVLAPNDNSKNQIYLGGNLSAVNVIPMTHTELFLPASNKKTIKNDSRLIRGKVSLSWMDFTGATYKAPEAKMILYPQYPEVRFSGFMKGCQANLSEWMQPQKSGRLAGRILIIGIDRNNSCYGYLALPGSRLSADIEPQLDEASEKNALRKIEIPSTDGMSTEDILISELRRIYLKSPIAGKKLNNKTGLAEPYLARNGAGYTLEAELGVGPNGIAGPDFKGWEVKADGSSAITLFTPEPDGGIYSTEGFDYFINKYGYPDNSGKKDRVNFGGVHKAEKRSPKAGLTLRVTGYPSAGVFDPEGAIILHDDTSETAMSWSFVKLIAHWNKKHAQTAFVRYTKEQRNKINYYSYANFVHLGEGTDFDKFIRAVRNQHIYYDPALKIEKLKSGKLEKKRRNQFRVSPKNLSTLYNTWTKREF
jgi:hypothetical protein